MTEKILWDEPTGTVYWKFNNEEIAFSPMLNDNTCDLQKGGIIDCWESEETEKRVKGLLN